MKNKIIESFTEDLIKISLAFVFLSGISAGCVNAQNIPNQDSPKVEVVSDLSTDAGVIAELQKIGDAKRAELPKADEKIEAKRRAASRLESKNVCIKRLKESAKVIVIGFFRTDVGCHFSGAFVGSRYFEKTDLIDLSKAALEAFGWQKANQTEREKLAAAWVEKGLLAFYSVLYAKPSELENVGFHPPQFVSEKNGAVKINLFIQLPSRMTREKGFQHLEYRFAADGTFTGYSTLGNYIS